MKQDKLPQEKNSGSDRANRLQHFIVIHSVLYNPRVLTEYKACEKN